MAKHINEDFLKSVAFLYVKKRGAMGTISPDPVGTAFFLEVKLGGTHTTVCYVVTCNHVIEKAKHNDICIRVNLVGGESQDIQVKDWFTCREMDLAAARCSFPSKYQVIFQPIPLERLVREEQIRNGTIHNFGIGSEVFYAGLFSEYVHTRRIYPIARFATIAMMPPHEKIPIQLEDETWINLDGYYIESRSWGGHSGSPVFLFDIFQHHDISAWSEHQVLPAPNMLGVLHAHHNIPGDLKTKKGYVFAKISMNSGIAIVSKAERLYEFLMNEEMQMDRKQLSEKLKQRRHSPTLDSVQIAHSVVEAAIGEPLTRPKAKPKKRAKKASRRGSK